MIQQVIVGVHDITEKIIRLQVRTLKNVRLWYQNQMLRCFLITFW